MPIQFNTENKTFNLKIRSQDGRVAYTNVYLPDVVPDNEDGVTFTIETKFRFTYNQTGESTSTMRVNQVFGFRLNQFNTISDADHRTVGLVYDGTNKYSNETYLHYVTTYDSTEAKFEDANFNAVRNAWQMVDGKCEFITMKISVKDGYLYGVFLECNGNKWSVCGTSQNDSKFDGTLALYTNQCGVDISYIRVVEGVTADIDSTIGYSALNGVFKDASYSDYCNTKVTGTGYQNATDKNSVRLTADIDPEKFVSAGFKVAIFYKLSSADLITETKDLQVKCAYTSLIADTGRGIEEVTPEDEGDYIIAMVINNLDTIATEGAGTIEIMYTPYAVDANGVVYTGRVCAYTLSSYSGEIR